MGESQRSFSPPGGAARLVAFHRSVRLLALVHVLHASLDLLQQVFGLQFLPPPVALLALLLLQQRAKEPGAHHLLALAHQEGVLEAVVEHRGFVHDGLARSVATQLSERGDEFTVPLYVLRRDVDHTELIQGQQTRAHVRIVGFERYPDVSVEPVQRGVGQRHSSAWTPG